MMMSSICPQFTPSLTARGPLIKLWVLNVVGFCFVNPLMKKDLVFFPNLQDEKKEKDCKVVDVVVVNQKKDEDEEDWLPPPPRKIPNSGSGFIEDKTLQELRFVYPQFSIVIIYRREKIGFWWMNDNGLTRM